jgi:type I restriction enzyme S subunit
MIENYINNKFPGDHPHNVSWRNELIRACSAFIKSGLADPKFLKELVSGEENKFWSCISEALVAKQLNGKIFPQRIKLGVGPDFLVLDGDKKVWIEVICPEPVQLPSDWTNNTTDKVVDFPHEDILLRWTSAIKVKAERLIGKKQGPKGYLASGIVSHKDAYVIAVNSCRLRNGPFSCLMGISQFPFAAEAVFGLGPFQITISKKTLETVSTGYRHRPFVKNRNGANVPAFTFLDPAFEPISAIWAVDLNGHSAFGGSEPTYVVHNPNATCPISKGFLPSLHDYVARLEEDHYVLDQPKR